MPVVFRENGYRFHFYSNEGDPRESVHIHVNRAEFNAKFWLYPEVRMAYNYGFSGRQLADIEAIVTINRDRIEEAWNDHFA